MKSFQKIIASICLLVAVVFSAEWTGGINEIETSKIIDGKNYYEVSTAEELAYIAKLVNYGATNINVVLKNDIILGKDTSSIGSYSWTSIGNNSTVSFNGIFDGAGHSIYGLYIDETKGYMAGLFGILESNGIVKNVNLRHSLVIVESTLSGKPDEFAEVYVGSLIAINKGSLDNSSNKGLVIVRNGTYQKNYQGGLVGLNMGFISNSSNSDSLYFKRKNGGTGFVGGITGSNHGGNISNCQNTANIVSDGRTGGIAGDQWNGDDYASIDKCVNSGNIYLDETNTLYGHGGIVGSLNGYIRNCVNKGNIYNGTYNGGIVGFGFGLTKNSFSVSKNIGSDKKDNGGVAGHGSNTFNCYYDSTLLSNFQAQPEVSDTAFVLGKPTNFMQSNEFAWILNTTNGTEENSGLWSRYNDYPIFSNDTLQAIKQITFIDGNFSTALYTDYTGRIKSFPIPRSPNGQVFVEWRNSNGEYCDSKTSFTKDQTIVALYREWMGNSREPSESIVIDNLQFYVIKNAEELAWFAEQVNRGNNSINAVLNNDIVFGKDETTPATHLWNPIGKNSSVMFAGILDGNGYTIYGLNVQSSSIQYAGLVGVMASSGILKNITLSTTQINTASDVTGTAFDYHPVYAGSFVGLNNGEIVNCKSIYGSVLLSGVLGMQRRFSGGIVGYNAGTIANTINESRVYVYTIGGMTIAEGVGGIAGLNKGKIIDCENSARVNSAFEKSGGIVGWNEGSIIRSTNSGTVYTSMAYAGGISARNYSVIQDCKNTGSVIKTGAHHGHDMGGISGTNEGKIINSYSAADSITLGKSSSLNGGIVGTNGGSEWGYLTNCYFDSTLIPNLKTYAYEESYTKVVNVFKESTAKMQTDEFAWILNTTKGTSKNSRIWSRFKDYPVIANDSLLPIFRIIFVVNGDSIIKFTNYKGMIAEYPIPKAEAGKAIAGWVNETNDTTFAINPIFTKDQVVLPYYLAEEEVYYTIRFFDESGSLVDSQSVMAGEIPTYKGKSLKKESSVSHTYYFNGWNPKIEKATWHKDYVVTFGSLVRQYKITYLDYDSTVLFSAKFDYGTRLSYKDMPRRTSDSIYSYSFSNWNPSIQTVKDDAVYIASYDSALVKYSVMFMNGEDLLQAKLVAYGELPSYTGKHPTKSGFGKYDYTFVGWTPELEIVTDATVYKAVFDSTEIQGNAIPMNITGHFNVNAIGNKQIQISNVQTGFDYMILDLQGRIIAKGATNQSSVTISLNTQGHYIVKVNQELRFVSVR